MISLGTSLSRIGAKFSVLTLWLEDSDALVNFAAFYNVKRQSPINQGFGSLCAGDQNSWCHQFTRESARRCDNFRRAWTIYNRVREEMSLIGYE